MPHLNILKQMISPKQLFSHHCTSKYWDCLQRASLAHTKATNDLEKRRAEIMSRGLPKQKPIPGVKDVIMVVSGKGGVGKSTTAVNLAVALADSESKPQVGLLDADVFGPSIPLMMNLNEEPLLTNDNKMIPLINYNVKCISIGFLVSETSAVIWRGLMVMDALDKLLRRVDWGQIDYLIVDTPPGTGDTLLTLMQNIPITGVVMVSTPQKAALQVTRRGATMLQKLSIPIIGIVQNMGSVQCPKCVQTFSVFGEGTVKLASELGIELLCDVPLDSEIASCGDSGKPIAISQSGSPQVHCYKTLAVKVQNFVKNQLKIRSSK